VTADYAAALRALPFLFFPFQQLTDSFPADELQVLDHIHTEVSLVSFIQMDQARAGEVAALKTEADFPVEQQVASLFDECTLFIPMPASAAIRYAEPFLFQVVLKRKVSRAHGAIHTAGSDQAGVHGS